MGKLAYIANRMVDIPANVTITPRIQLRLAGGIQLGLIISHVGEDDRTHSDLAGDLGQQGLADGGKEMEYPELGLEGLTCSRNQGVCEPVERTEAIGKGHSANPRFEGNVTFHCELTRIGKFQGARKELAKFNGSVLGLWGFQDRLERVIKGG